MNKKVFLFTSLGLAAVIGLLAYIKISQFTSAPKQAQPPVSISSFTVKKDQWQSSLSAIGSLEAAKGLQITADLSGRVSNILFDAGSQVKAGDLLVEQDTTAERAQLRSAQAAAALAKSNLSRIEALYQKQVASKSEYDNARSLFRSANADVDNIQATIEKKSIRAPFDGQLGIRLVNLGQSINAGEPVVSLQATRQMFVNFFLPQQFLSQLEPGLSVEVRSDAVPNDIFSGKITVIDPKINEATRSIKIQALLDNSEEKLLPGMFAKLKVILPEVKDVLLIPVTAVQYATFGDSVFVIETAESQTDAEKKPDNSSETTTETSAEKDKPLVARQQFVKLGEARGDFVNVLKGLEAEQIVASAGVFKLRNGAGVVINNSVVPEYSLNPEVDNK